MAAGWRTDCRGRDRSREISEEAAAKGQVGDDGPGEVSGGVRDMHEGRWDNIC